MGGRRAEAGRHGRPTGPGSQPEAKRCVTSEGPTRQHRGMPLLVAQANTDEEKEAVYRFRYSVYVEEMGRYQDTADHVGRRLVEAEDEHSWIFYARDGDNVVGTARLSWGSHGFSERQIDE